MLSGLRSKASPSTSRRCYPSMVGTGSEGYTKSRRSDHPDHPLGCFHQSECIAARGPENESQWRTGGFAIGSNLPATSIVGLDQYGLCRGRSQRPHSRGGTAAISDIILGLIFEGSKETQFVGFQRLQIESKDTNISE